METTGLKCKQQGLVSEIWHPYYQEDQRGFYTIVVLNRGANSDIYEFVAVELPYLLCLKNLFKILWNIICSLFLEDQMCKTDFKSDIHPCLNDCIYWVYIRECFLGDVQDDHSHHMHYNGFQKVHAKCCSTYDPNWVPSGTCLILIIEEDLSKIVEDGPVKDDPVKEERSMKDNGEGESEKTTD